MGHWEQLSRDNAEERARRAALPAWQRALSAHGRAAIVAAAWVLTVLVIIRFAAKILP